MHKFNLITLFLLFILSVAAASPLSPELAMVKRSSGRYITLDDKHSSVNDNGPDYKCSRLNNPGPPAGNNTQNTGTTGTSSSG
jgi:hypothetical protein